MDAPERSSLISDIRPAGETYGFPAAAGTVAATVEAGHTIYVCAIRIRLSRHLEFWRIGKSGANDVAEPLRE
ncbi:hypothetical protein BTHE_1453 [Bifidobacterium thermophilum]|nr:hypothetical protein BTHE_1453 [Bifidobacterium thermophilum]